MLSKSDKRCRQKLRRRIRNVNPEAALEYFQVSVNILEAKNLAWANTQTVNTYVVIMLGKEKYRTNVRKKMEEPLYKEYLIFEWNTSIRELQKSHLWMAVMEPRFCAPPRLLGETSIDLGIVWAQPNHQVFHKWVQLSLPRNPTSGTVGFLKVDISILCRGDVQVMPVMVTTERHDKSNLTSAEQQRANYVVTVYNGFGISSGSQEHVESARPEKLTSTYVKVSFCGISVKTTLQPRSHNPSYCEQVSIVEMFPNMCQTIRIEVCSAVPSLNQVLASIEVNLGQISHDGDNGFVPTFGPSLLHMYTNSIKNGIECPGEDGPFYRGALLVALKTVVPYLQQIIKSTSMEPVVPIQMDNLWEWDDFYIICPVFEVSMLDCKVLSKSCGVAITIGEIPTESCANEDFMLKRREMRKRKLHYSGSIEIARCTANIGNLNFAYAYPVLQLAPRLPGFRYRIYRNNLVQRIADQLGESLRNVENRLNNFEFTNPSELLADISNAVDIAAMYILKFFEVIHLCDPTTLSHGDKHLYSTELDLNQLTLQKEELEKIYNQITEKIKLNPTITLMKRIGSDKQCFSVSKKNVKMLLDEANKLAQRLNALVFKTAQGWPDIVVWLLNEGSRYAYYKINAPDVVFSEIKELSGKNCGRIHTIYLKPLKCTKHVNTVQNICTCIAAKVELLFWMGLYTDLRFLDSCIPEGLTIKTKDHDMCIKASVMVVEVRVFIYRAKITTIESVISPSTFVRISVLNSVKETQIQAKTMTPVWDQVLTVNCMTRISLDRITISPPEITMELYSQEAIGKLELIGRSEIQPVVSYDTEPIAPKLKWYSLHKGPDVTGQIFTSALIQQVPETIVKSTIYSSYNVINETETQEDVKCVNEVIEKIPRSLKPKFLSYKVDVYWWGLRDVNVTRKPCAVLEIDNLLIKSDVIPENKSNCNFPNGRISQTFEAHLEKAYSAPLTIKLCDSSTFGRVIFLGTNAVKNPTKYLMDWLPKYDREASLKSVLFTSSNFFKVNKTLYLKDSITSESTELSKTMSSAIDGKNWSSWKRLFCRREPDEEEYVLLPILMKEKDPNQLVPQNSETEHQDWWSRFYCSQKHQQDDNASNSGKIKIFNSELESQLEYNKFKDWCKTVRLFKSINKGVPANKEVVPCGYLKAGIAIYRWPPPPETNPVSWDGVDLQKGFFHNYPSNVPSQFVVRVYVVRAMNLALDFNGSCNPYLLLKNGQNTYGDRNQFLQNTINPIFGRTYEFRCKLPEDYLLTISLLNFETLTHDALIGSTTIDLEDRIYSKHRGRLGLSTKYSITGCAKWRDNEKPSEILTKLCARNHMQPPSFPDGNTVIVNGFEYRDADKSNKTYISASERKENICLNLLHKWHTLPLCGYHLVPEHVETRKLFNPEKPDVEKGIVQLWIDIFPLETGIYLPLPTDISPRKIEDYELRVIIWQVKCLRHEGISVKKDLDLYVKA